MEPTDEQYTLESFEVTAYNREAFDSAIRFADNKSSKPLCIFGNSETGKTHLLYAIREYIQTKEPETDVVLINGKIFSSELIHTFKIGKSQKNRYKTLKEFHEKYTKCDVLLFDNIQDIAGKHGSQEEFILIFNELFESGKRIMVTSSGIMNSKFKNSDVRLISRCFFGDHAIIDMDLTGNIRA